MFLFFKYNINGVEEKGVGQPDGAGDSIGSLI